MNEDRAKVPGKKLGLPDGERKHTLERFGDFWADVTGLAKKKSMDSVTLYREKDGEYKVAGFRRVGLYRKERQ